MLKITDSDHSPRTQSIDRERVLSVGRSCEKVCFELGVRVADGESGES